MEVGDKVVCVNGVLEGYISYLTNGKVYNVIDISVHAIKIEADMGGQGWYNPWRFIKLKEYRRKKLEAIAKC